MVRISKGKRPITEPEEIDPRVDTFRAEFAAHRKRVEERDAEKLAAFRAKMHEIRTMSEREAAKSLGYMRPKGYFADWDTYR